MRWRLRLRILGAVATMGVLAVGLLLLGHAPWQAEVHPAGGLHIETVRNAGGEPVQAQIESHQITGQARAEELLPAEPPPSPASRPPDANDSSRALDARALRAWREGDIREALDAFAKALTADTDDPTVRSHYGRLLLLMGDLVQARAHLEHAAVLTPDDPQVWLDLASFYERSLELERANDARQRAEALAGGRRIERDPRGLWTIEGEGTMP